MKERIGWLIAALLVLALILISGSAKGVIPLPLPWVVGIALGISAALALWENRQKMHQLLG